MCGIFGVSGLDNAAELTYLGLYALQHRGQESAGIVTIDEDGIPQIQRKMGLVHDVFPVEAIERLRGTVAIGHTRYSTTGSSVAANAQPVVVNYHQGPLVLAHNGNLTNASELKEDLVRSGSIFQTSSDSETLIHLIARSDARRPRDQIRDALERVEGAFTLLLSVGKTLYAVVDSRGFRPLVMGRLGNGCVLASETCALDIVGAKPERELEPGEWIRIEDGKVTELERLSAKPHRRCVFELIYFSRPDSVVFHRSVDAVRRELGRHLAREHPAPDADCVFAVPDSSNAMALGYAEVTGLKYEHGLIRNHYIGRTFINPGQANRMAKVRIKFNTVREVVEGKEVVVVDDSLVRGTTSKLLMEMIRQAGARAIHLRLASPPITGPCVYGIDTPTRSELAAARMSVEEIRRYVGVDTLGYLSLEGTLKACGGDPDGFCHACFSGKYPTAMPNHTGAHQAALQKSVTALGR